MKVLPEKNISTPSDLCPPFDEEVAEVCKRMLNFLYEVKPAGHVFYCLSPSSRPRFSHFTLTRTTESGFEFEDRSYSRDGTQCFFVPFAYVANPEIWEEAITRAMKQDRELARKEIEKRLGAVSPDEFTLDVIRMIGDADDKVYLKVRLHPGMKTACNEQLVTLFGGKGILAVPVFKIEV